MNKLIQILNWPAKSSNNYTSWYEILWRLLCAPIVYIGLFLTFIGLCMSHGCLHAVAWWKRFN